MGIEIERKFLVNDMSWKPSRKRLSVIQGYFPTSGFSLRVRVQDDKAFLTLKKGRSQISRHEFEYEIPAGDAREMIGLFCGREVIEKTRHLVEYKGFTWEVDEFHGENDGLIVAELELEYEDMLFDKPSWIGEEVTQDSRYLNACLAKRPYRTWSK
jgi:adenylate cyclase